MISMPVAMNIVLEHKSEIDLCATIIDRFLTNMLKQMEELNGIEMETRERLGRQNVI